LILDDDHSIPVSEPSPGGLLCRIGSDI